MQADRSAAAQQRDPLDRIADALVQLADRMDDLNRRVAALEQGGHTPPPPSVLQQLEAIASQGSSSQQALAELLLDNYRNGLSLERVHELAIAAGLVDAKQGESYARTREDETPIERRIAQERLERERLEALARASNLSAPANAKATTLAGWGSGSLADELKRAHVGS